MDCARCHHVPSAPGRTRCAGCAAKDRRENRAKYQKRGGWGGRRGGVAHCGRCGAEGCRASNRVHLGSVELVDLKIDSAGPPLAEDCR